VPCLNAEVDKMGPADVVKTSRAMNAAYESAENRIQHLLSPWKRGSQGTWELG